jgi:acetoacetyl-CoA reductase/3-oxoacyl-[acyl-carrier protein] reductase
MPRIEANRTALVTAAANGIGRACAIAVARTGCDMILFDLEPEGLEATRQCVAEAGVVVEAHVVDCTRMGEVEAALGGRAVDILVNAVGSSARERSCRFEDSTPELWRFVHEVSLVSAMACTRAVISGMKGRGWGRIVSLASDAALRPTVMMAEYAAAKAGVIGFTRALASEYGADGITANVIAPGLIRTRALDNIAPSVLEASFVGTPLARVGEPEEVAHAVTFLIDEMAGYITGQTIAVNGGRTYL